ncbi:hypothetical protein KJ877_10650 [bacterium]|nr:hypothetical protein [bacterium]MBU1990280.1 hypothetical protein [bacterium]
MKISVKGKLMSLYKKPDFKDRESGEVTPGKHNLELLVETELSNGSIKHDMQDISIPDSRVEEFKSQVGKEVNVNCSYISKSPVSFYVS